LRQPPKRVLCVEDNKDICFMLSSLLQRAGYVPVMTFTAGDALTLAGREEFDLFILDTWLGESSGVDLCRAVRAIRPEALVLFYSAAIFDSDREAALEAGACEYVAKPGTEGLVEAVRRALGDA
jgi:DNA-binding response OmpR family regulator